MSEELFDIVPTDLVLIQIGRRYAIEEAVANSVQSVQHGFDSALQLVKRLVLDDELHPIDGFHLTETLGTQTRLHVLGHEVAERVDLVAFVAEELGGFEQVEWLDVQHVELHSVQFLVLHGLVHYVGKLCRQEMFVLLFDDRSYLRLLYHFLRLVVEMRVLIEEISVLDIAQDHLSQVVFVLVDLVFEGFVEFEPAVDQHYVRFVYRFQTVFLFTIVQVRENIEMGVL